jgi:hypothetical protein
MAADESDRADAKLTARKDLKRAHGHFWTAGISMIVVWEEEGPDSNNFDYRFDFHCHVERKRSHPDGAASVPTSVPEHFDKQIRATVDHLWMVGKFRYGIDHAKNSAKMNDLIQAAASNWSPTLRACSL